jgi:TolB-like protein
VTPDGDREVATFAEGMMAELRNVLSQVTGLRVASRTTSIAAAGAGLATPAAIGQTLNTAFLLEGTVQHQRGRVRVTVRLVNVAADSTAWSGMYERSAADLFAAEDSVATAIATGVRPHIMGQ